MLSSLVKSNPELRLSVIPGAGSHVHVSMHLLSSCSSYSQVLWVSP